MFTNTAVFTLNVVYFVNCSAFARSFFGQLKYTTTLSLARSSLNSNIQCSDIWTINFYRQITVTNKTIIYIYINILVIDFSLYRTTSSSIIFSFFLQLRTKSALYKHQLCISAIFMNQYLDNYCVITIFHAALIFIDFVCQLNNTIWLSMNTKSRF